MYLLYSISYYYFFLYLLYSIPYECLACPVPYECLTIFTTHYTFHSSSLLSSEIQLVSLCNSYSDHESSHLCYTDTSQKILKHLCHSWSQVVTHFLSHNNI